MSAEYPGLLRLVEKTFAGGATVQDPIEWMPSTWLKRFPSGSLAAQYLRELEGQPLTRAAILDVARTIPDLSEADRAFAVERLFLLSQVWGYGTVGYGAYRTAAIMRPAPFIGVVGRVHATLIERGADAAYRSMRRGAPENLKGLGPAFATKFLYFAGYGLVPRNTPEPLILDSLVGAALHDVEPASFGPSTGRVWDPEAYSLYLHAAQSACVNSTANSLTPADVEYALFQAGRQL